MTSSPSSRYNPRDIIDFVTNVFYTKRMRDGRIAANPDIRFETAGSIEIMAGVLTGAAYGPNVANLYKEGDPPANVGHFFILLNIAKCMPMEDYFALVEKFVLDVKKQVYPFLKEARNENRHNGTKLADRRSIIGS
jgi:hypothetical protein